MNWAALLAGYGGPFLAVVFGIAGVVLGRYIAMGLKKEGEERLTPRLNVALALLFSLVVLGYVRENPETSPLRLLGYGSAAGFIGLGLLEFAADQLFDRFKAAFRGFTNPSAVAQTDDEIGITAALNTLRKDDDGPPGNK